MQVCEHEWVRAFQGGVSRNIDKRCRLCGIRFENRREVPPLPKARPALGSRGRRDIGEAYLVLDKALGSRDGVALAKAAFRAHRILDRLAEELQIDLSEIDL